MKQLIIKSFFFFCILSILNSNATYGQLVAYLPVHFLYGSRPLQKYKFIEGKWFGGKMGGHVGIEIDSNKILNFGHSGSFHVLNRKKKKHGRFILSTTVGFNTIFGGKSNKVKKLTIMIPVTKQQLQKLDSVSKEYINQPPYDYALLGMRCAAASYEILAQLEILPQFSNAKTSFKIFYPKILRKQLLQKAEENGWPMITQEGTDRRIWESD